MKYKMTFDLHTHTTFSHGKGSIEENVKVAIDKGLEGIAISDHGRDHLFFGIRKDALKEMRKEIERLKEVYPQIQIYLSVEANIYDIGNGTDAKILEQKYCDFIIAGYHFGVHDGYCISNWLHSKGLIRNVATIEKYKQRNTKMIVSAIKANNLKILTHPGDKAIIDIMEVAKACEENNVLMEISSHHEQLTVEDLKKLKNTEVRFVISSDAHKPEHIGTFEPALKRALEAEIDINRIVNIEEVDEAENINAFEEFDQLKEENNKEELVTKVEGISEASEEYAGDKEESVNDLSQVSSEDTLSGQIIIEEVSENVKVLISEEEDVTKVEVVEESNSEKPQVAIDEITERVETSIKTEDNIGKPKKMTYESAVVADATLKRDYTGDTIWDVDTPKKVPKEHMQNMEWDVEKKTENSTKYVNINDSIMWEKTEFPIRKVEEHYEKKEPTPMKYEKLNDEDKEIVDIEKEKNKKAKKKAKKAEKDATAIKGEQTMMDLSAILDIKEPTDVVEKEKNKED